MQRQQNAVISLEKSKANIELELKTVRMKYDQEALAHKETIARFNADKKNILHSTEEANLEALKGRPSVVISICSVKLHQFGSNHVKHSPQCIYTMMVFARITVQRLS